jgi:hypothetical protein
VKVTCPREFNENESFAGGGSGGGLLVVVRTAGGDANLTPTRHPAAGAVSHSDKCGSITPPTYTSDAVTAFLPIA